MPANSISQAKWPATIGFTIGIAALVSTVPTTFAFDKVYASSILTLAVLCCFLFVLPRLPLPSLLLSRSGHEEKGYSTVPLGDLGGSSRSQSPVRPASQATEYPPSLRRLRLCFLGLVIAVCCRVETLRLTVRNIECSGSTWSPIIPLVFALSDYWFYQRHRRVSVDAANAGFLGRLLQSPSTPLWSSAVLAIAGVSAWSASTGPRSTYICPVTSPFYKFTPIVQHLGTFIDIVIILCLDVVSQSQDGPSSKGSGSPRFATVSYAAIVSCTILAIIGSFVYFFSHPDDQHDLRRFHHLFMYSTLAFSAISSLTLVCGIVVVHHFGIVSTIVFATAASVLSGATSFVLGYHGVYPPTRNTYILVAVSFTILAFSIFNRHRAFSDGGQASSVKVASRTPKLLYIALLIIFAIHMVLWLFQPAATFSHPLDGIIAENEVHHQTFATAASSSKSLSAASEAYRKRYGRHPPPRFDEWYRYATNRSSQIIDIFDGLHDDILPFWSLSPHEVRERTWSMVATPYNEAGAILIRDGLAKVHEGVRPTHRWMLDGVVDILKNFSEFLPDMDLAFNMNDECRVAVPYRVINPMRTAATRELPPAEKPRNSFSADRKSQWKTLPDPPVPESESPLVEMSWKNIFYEFGSTGCPPQSPARRQRLWDVSQLCTFCAAPHSTQGFLRDWKKAGDPCHQPDLANLHGIYLAPSAFKSTNELYPVFSQSKVTGFNDILYPSAWNYIDKVKYEPSTEHPDPPFQEKNNSLIWRGATSEGLSAGKSQWQGMARQRFVHMTARNYTAAQSLLAPGNAEGVAEYHYQAVSRQAIKSGLSADVQIVNEIVRCHPQDCDQQVKEFGPLAGPMDFQDHWKYKFLLDLDGAGFSGRFLPFLRSGSLPFKAGLFREWWADRVTAWQHFVPLDIRGHGLWDTLAYFAGFEAPEVDIHVPGQTERGEKIAKQGQEWANAVLRKEDMEIYFFRLLLEWGRLTDDDRDSIGYFG